MSTTTTSIFHNTGRHLVASALALSLGLGLAGAAQARDDGADFRARVEKGIDRTMRLPNAPDERRRDVVTVAVTLDPAGKILATDIVQSAGWKDFDQEALRTARAIAYPAPGRTVTVAMVLGFNRKVTADMQKKAERKVLAWREEQRVMLANKTGARQPDS